MMKSSTSFHALASKPIVGHCDDTHTVIGVCSTSPKNMTIHSQAGTFSKNNRFTGLV